jgi:hypothetical protein
LTKNTQSFALSGHTVWVKANANNVFGFSYIEIVVVTLNDIIHLPDGEQNRYIISS